MRVITSRSASRSSSISAARRASGASNAVPRLAPWALRGAELRLGGRADARETLVEAARELGLEVGVVAVGERRLVVADHVADEDLDELRVELGAGDAAQLGDRVGRGDRVAVGV